MRDSSGSISRLVKDVRVTCLGVIGTAAVRRTTLLRNSDSVNQPELCVTYRSVRASRASNIPAGSAVNWLRDRDLRVHVLVQRQREEGEQQRKCQATLCLCNAAGKGHVRLVAWNRTR